MNNKKLYLFLILVLILILSYRISSQGRKMEEAIKEFGEQEQEMELPEIEEETIEEVELSETYRSPDGKLTFNYSSDWTPVEDDEMLDFYHKAPDPEELEEIRPEIPEEEIDLDMDELQRELEDQQEETEFKNREMHFVAMRTLLPQFSVGMISVQEMSFSPEKNKEEVVEKLKSDLEVAAEDGEEIVITDTTTDGYMSIIETEVLMGERPTFRTENIALISKEENKLFLLAFSSTYEDWEDFHSEFRRITSTIEFDEK